MILLLSLPIFAVFLRAVLPQKNITYNYRKVYLIIIGIAIAFIMGFRDIYTGSRDTEMYCRVFMNMENWDSFLSYMKQNFEETLSLLSEGGFYFFVWILTRIFNDPQVLVITSSLFVTFCVFYFIYKNSKDVFFSGLLYLTLGQFTFNMNGMKQAMAMAVCLLSYEFAKKRKIIKFLVVILIAMLFHKTAILFVIMYFIPLIKKPLHILYYFIGVVVFSVSSSQIITFYNKITDENYSIIDTTESGGVFTVLIYLFVILASLIVFKKFEATERGYFFAVLTGMMLYVSRYISTGIIERASYYFYYFLILLLPNALTLFKGKDRQMLKLLFGFFAILLFAYRAYTGTFSDFKLCF